jgi:hypothetical protein
VANNQVIHAQFEEEVTARFKSSFGVENGLVKLSPEAHGPKRVYTARPWPETNRK